MELFRMQPGFRPQPGVEPRGDDLQPLDAAGVEDGDLLFLRVKNASSRTLRVTVLDLDSEWSVSQLWPERGAGESSPIDSGRRPDSPIFIKVTLPPGGKTAMETFKIFATVEPTSLRWLELPAMKTPRTAVASRGTPRVGNPLEELLFRMGGDVASTRGELVLVSAPGRDWAVRQVVARIRAKGAPIDPPRPRPQPIPDRRPPPPESVTSAPVTSAPVTPAPVASAPAPAIGGVSADYLRGFRDATNQLTDALGARGTK
ncbi:hypothetical protein [Sorangium sp. So ce1389]|uniref:hypothetical protein n=1 Tax=Sorangium sp. So ce1389 TaxID=3133336 RepID=UPI003F6064DF